MTKINFKNAVLYKELQLNAKKLKLPLLLFIINIIFTLIAFIVLLNINLSFQNLYGDDSDILHDLFSILVFMESALVCLLLPSLTSQSISGERERQTLDVLITTSMSPFEIILGKFFSCLTYVVIVLLSIMPLSSLILIYGSISLWDMLSVIGTIVTTGIFFSAFGIFFSARQKKTSSATLLTFINFANILVGTIMFVVILTAIGNMITDALSYSSGGLRNIVVDLSGSFFILYFNPATTVFNTLCKVGGSFFGVGSSEGMGIFVRTVVINISPSDFLIVHWTGISIVIQMITSFFLLKGAANAIDPTKQKIKVKKKWMKKTA